PLRRRRLLARYAAAAALSSALRVRRWAHCYRPHRGRDRGPQTLPRRARRGGGEKSPGRRRQGRCGRHPVRSDRARQPDRGEQEMSREIIEAVHVIEKEKGIDGETLISALEDALLAAYKKTPGATRHATVELDRGEGDFRVFSIDLPKDIEERLIEEARERAITELEQIEDENGERSHTLINDDDLDIDWTDVPDDQIKREDVTPHDFGRIAAQTAKQVILQRIREAEREMMYEEYVDRVTEVVTGIVQQAGDRNNVLVDLGKVEALLPRGEKIDIIPWNTEPARFIAKALSPARVREVLVDDETKEATVIVPEDQLALAIGKEGLNARLAARLTGWKVDIQSDAEFAQSEAEAAFAGGDTGEEFSGRCVAILANGKRCPNAAVPGSRFCGIPAHRELAEREARGETLEASQVVGGVSGEEEEAPVEETGAAEEPVAEAPPVEEATEEAPPAEERPAEEEPAEVEEPAV